MMMPVMYCVKKSRASVGELWDLYKFVSTIWVALSKLVVLEPNRRRFQRTLVGRWMRPTDLRGFFVFRRVDSIGNEEYLSHHNGTMHGDNCNPKERSRHQRGPITSRVAFQTDARGETLGLMMTARPVKQKWEMGWDKSIHLLLRTV